MDQVPVEKKCQRCESNSILSFSAKHDDLTTSKYQGRKYNGYGLTDTPWCYCSDYVKFNICVKCGQMQDNHGYKFPLLEDPILKRLKKDSEEEEE